MRACVTRARAATAACRSVASASLLACGIAALAGGASGAEKESRTDMRRIEPPATRAEDLGIKLEGRHEIGAAAQFR